MSLAVPVVAAPAGGAADACARVYLREDGSAWGGTIAGICPRPARFDPLGALAFLNRRAPPRRTVVAGVEKVAPGWEVIEEKAVFSARRAALPAADPVAGLAAALTAAVVEAVAAARAAGQRVALAISGGLDSAALLEILARAGIELPLYLLVTGIPGYCERREAAAAAAAFGLPVREVFATPADFVAALPEALAAAEAPFYNLHLAGNLLLARALARDGIGAVITGHAADQVLALAPPRSLANFLPWTGAMFAAAGVALLLPFLDPRVAAAARAAGGDPRKVSLRRLLAGRLPAEVLEAPKVPRFAPAFPLDLWEPARRIPPLWPLLPVLAPRLPRGAAEELLLVSLELLGERFGILPPLD